MLLQLIIEVTLDLVKERLKYETEEFVSFLQDILVCEKVYIPE
jgi:hypothetical protein